MRRSPIQTVKESKHFFLGMLNTEIDARAVFSLHPHPGHALTQQALGRSRLRKFVDITLQRMIYHGWFLGREDDGTPDQLNPVLLRGRLRRQTRTKDAQGRRAMTTSKESVSFFVSSLMFPTNAQKHNANMPAGAAMAA